MAFPLNQIGGGIRVNSSLVQVGLATIFGGQALQLPQSVNYQTAFNSKVAGADAMDVIVANRYTSSDAGVALYLNSSTSGNRPSDPHGNKVQFDRVGALLVRNLSITHAVDVEFVWGAGPLQGTDPVVRLMPGTANSPSLLLFIAPGAAGFDVAGTSEQDYLKFTNVDSGQNVICEVLIGGVSI